MNKLAERKKKEKEITEEDVELSKFTEEDIKAHFPALYNELSGEQTPRLSSDEARELLSEESVEDSGESVQVNGPEIELETDTENEVKTTTKPMEKDYLRGFDPQAIDFIRRAKTNNEAVDVLNYLEKRGEITPEDCQSLKNQLERDGLASFGEHKQDGYYFEYQRKRHMEEKMKLIGKQPVE